MGVSLLAQAANRLHQCPRSKPLTLEQAEDARDACARALYGTLFLSIVDNTNQYVCTHAPM